MVDRTNFIGSLLPYALEASKRTGVDPRIIIAQGALESNWGKSAPGNNYFGIKSHGQSGGNTLSTTEVINGQPVHIKDSFRAYGNPGESVSGYADFINSNPRYRDFRTAGDFNSQIDALGRSGYATDPNYSSKIRSIASGIDVGTQYASADGPKGQETYSPMIGSMAVASATSPSQQPIINAGGGNYVKPPENIPEAARAIAGTGAPKKGIADIFSLLALQGQQQDQPQVAPVQGPSPEQAQALLNVLKNLNMRQA